MLVGLKVPGNDKEINQDSKYLANRPCWPMCKKDFSKNYVYSASCFYLDIKEEEHDFNNHLLFLCTVIRRPF